jgi:hypothetical protein
MAADLELIAADLQVDLFGVYAGQIEADIIIIVSFVDIYCRLPASTGTKLEK